MERAQELGIRTNGERVRDFLSEQITYEADKSALHTFERYQTHTGYIYDQWQAEMAGVSSIKGNDGCTFTLTCEEALSLYAWVVHVRSKRITRY